MTDNIHTIATDLAAWERTLERQANAWLAARERDETTCPRVFLVCDLEYRFRREAHKAWSYGRELRYDKRGHRIEEKIRWPFQTIAAAAWVVVRFDGQSDVPEIAEPVVMTLGDHAEVDILSSFFDTLDAIGRDARMVTWGGEARDLAVLRYQACRHGLDLPAHLHDTSPHARERIDLCRSTAVQADAVHLDEYAAGCGIPAKPSPPEAIGKLVEAGEWEAVHDHVLADVLTTTIIGLRWLAALGEIVCDRERSAMAIADAALAACPDSAFVIRDFKPWARDRLREAALRGNVYRMEQAA
ncbi:hypothetical protein F7D01_04735 [Erythrobacter sp. 3-20A1M]|uniref:3'-5' exonuclease n=1 Tax=Erythrobacter sp. 3-20A1M TaxID=2653850 RepID=UPI001BFC22C3|nr:3'-5' exonuclease [Erythrobacter sp. 3-20A1M]QWC56490.1 hypothetical protein F7D01_04735 [Erythrobacter sp. 3-20A1M]